MIPWLRKLQKDMLEKMCLDLETFKRMVILELFVFLLVGLVAFKVMSIKTVIEVTMLKEIIIILILTTDFVNRMFSLSLKGEIERREKS